MVWVAPLFFFFQAEDGIRDLTVTGVQTCALPIFTGALGAGLRGTLRAGWRRATDQAGHGSSYGGGGVVGPGRGRRPGAPPGPGGPGARPPIPPAPPPGAPGGRGGGGPPPPAAPGPFSLPPSPAA